MLLLILRLIAFGSAQKSLAENRMEPVFAGNTAYDSNITAPAFQLGTLLIPLRNSWNKLALLKSAPAVGTLICLDATPQKI
jgi:hypothetical protein